MRRFRNKRPHDVNGLSNNTVCVRIIHLVRTGLTLLPGINQASHFLLLHRDLLREKIYSLYIEYYLQLQRYPYHCLQREPHRQLQIETLPDHPPIILVQFQRVVNNVDNDIGTESGRPRRNCRDPMKYKPK